MSTIDIDFDVPVKAHLEVIEKTFNKLGFKKMSTFSWNTNPIYPFRVDFFQCGYIFCVQLPNDSRIDAKIILNQKKLNLFCLNPYDLICTKLLRFESRDLDDSIITCNKLNLDIRKLLIRFLDIASGSMIREQTVIENFQYFLRYLKHIQEKDIKICQTLLKEYNKTK